jgi:type IV pilus assembly protein PilE
MKPSSQRGVTLMELMIVLTVIGILTAIAVPSYREQVNKGNRAEARALMYEVLQKEERYYSDRGIFTTDLTQLGYPVFLTSSHGSHSITLAVGVTGSLASSLNVTATASNDAKCATLTLASNQATSATGSTPTTCW